jgi:gas vesicle protein
MNDDTKRIIRITGITAVAVAVAGTVAALLVRDQISRQRRNLFNPRSLRRMAALQHIARQEASVDDINLLRDYISWEPRRMLRNRARAIVARMEEQARDAGETAREAVV